MKRQQLKVSWLALLVMALGMMAVPAFGQAEKVTVCHAAGQAGTLQYVELNVPPNEGGFPQGHFTEDGSAEAGHEDDILGPCPTDETTTTTTVAETTTTVADTTTTTVASTTTTTVADTTTTQADTTTTTVADTTTSTITVAPPPVDPPPPVELEELPFTGLDTAAIIGLALLGLTSGALLVRKGQDEA